VAVAVADGAPRIFFGGPASQINSIPARLDFYEPVRSFVMPDALASDYICCMAVGVVGEREVLLAGNDAGRLCAWDVVTRRLLQDIAWPHSGGIRQLAVSNRGPYAFASAGHEGEVLLWSASFTIELSINLQTTVVSVAFCGDTGLAVGTLRGIVVIDVRQ
jgi:WD40 repeat protein